MSKSGRKPDCLVGLRFKPPRSQGATRIRRTWHVWAAFIVFILGALGAAVMWTHDGSPRFPEQTLSGFADEGEKDAVGQTVVAAGRTEGVCALEMVVEGVRSGSAWEFQLEATPMVPLACPGPHHWSVSAPWNPERPACSMTTLGEDVCLDAFSGPLVSGQRWRVSACAPTLGCPTGDLVATLKSPGV